jgi:dephospho-CoA kinase
VSNFSTSSAAPGPIVGLTGGIGSGKSTIANVFRSLEIPVWDADTVGRSLYLEDNGLQKWVIDRFGPACGLWHEGRLVGVNRAELAEIVFNDNNALQALNKYVHPLVRQRFLDWHKSAIKFHRPDYVVRESAILFESNVHLDCSHIVAVCADKSVRLKRAIARDGITESQALARMDQQITDEERSRRATHSLLNNPKSNVLSEVLKVHASIIASFG